MWSASNETVDDKSREVIARVRQLDTTRNWENYIGVVMRDAGQVAIIDGDTRERVAIVNTGFAVHILRSSSSGRNVRWSTVRL